MSLYTVNIKLENQPCLVIGGGEIASRKVSGLVDAGANVTVIAPEVSELLVKMAYDGIISVEKREFKKGDTVNYFIIIASTDVTEVNEKVYTEAKLNNKLINCVDIPEKCNFYVPGIVQRGDFQMAISSNGKSPYFVKKLKEYFEKRLYSELAEEMIEMEAIRAKVNKTKFKGWGERIEKMGEALDPMIKGIISRINK